MDAISDVSRASQIRSEVPRRPPLPQPLDLDELFGFNDALTRRNLEEEVVDPKYFDKHRVFINGVDSFIGKHLTLVLSQKLTEEPQKPVEETSTKGISPESNKIDENEENNKAASDVPKSKGKRQKSSPKSKESKQKTQQEKKRKQSSSPQKTSNVPITDGEEDFMDIILEKKPAYNTSRLTVAEYYDMMDLEPGDEREEFLKEKLGKYTEDLKMTSYTDHDTNRCLKKNVSMTERKSSSFEIIGTLKNSELEDGQCVPEGVSEVIEVSQGNLSFLQHLVTCGIFVYIINEDLDQVVEATWVLNALLNYIEDIKDIEESPKFNPPLFILISSFMTWTLTQPLNPNKPELPFIERDYRKRKPHPNYQLHYELEEQVIQMKKNGHMEAVILVCGIPYGHEEDVFSCLFEMAYYCLDLPVLGTGNNNLPVIHVESIGQVVGEVIKKRESINLPFVFVKDQLILTQNDVVKAITNNFGSGCWKTMQSPFCFLKEEITQSKYDQMTANVVLESCYPLINNEDIKWKYKTGFVESIKHIMKEFMDSKNLKPLYIVLYHSSNIEMKNVASKLSDHFHIPYLSLESVYSEYVTIMQRKLEQIERKLSINNEKNESNADDYTQIIEKCQEDSYLEESLELFKTLGSNPISDIHKLSEAQQIDILKQKMNKRLCINHGYILDSFPQTLQQVQLLFQREDGTEFEYERRVISNEGVVLPDYVVYLNKAQVPNPEQIAQGNHFSDTFSGPQLDGSLISEEILHASNNRIAEGETAENKAGSDSTGGATDLVLQESVEDLPVVKYLLSENENCKLVEIAVDDNDDTHSIFKNVLKGIERSEINAEKEYDDELSRDNQEVSVLEEAGNQRLSDNKKEITYESVKDSKFESQEAEFQMIKEAEEAELAVRSCPLLSYLISFVFPTLTNAILEVTAQRPQDPLDFMAEYLFKNNPDGRMMDPRELQLKQDMMKEKPRVMNTKACFT